MNVAHLPVPDPRVEADDRHAVLLAIVDRALGPHAHAATITVEEYARDIAHCSRATGYEAVKRGDVPSMRIAGRIVIPVPAIVVQLLAVPNNNGETNAEGALSKVTRSLPNHSGSPRYESGSA
jgi:hypothetical protein